MMFDLQPIIENEKIAILPLLESDFEQLFTIASDPKVWEQHPSKDRWKRDVFQTFFEGAIQSKGAVKVVDKKTGAVIGTSRFYDYNEAESSIFIGYTFYGVDSWGTGINSTVKSMMLNHAFTSVDSVYFHIGEDNIRSQVAIGRLGAEKIGEENVAYFGEQPKRNLVFRLQKNTWTHRTTQSA